jgi:hypothetical protein
VRWCSFTPATGAAPARLGAGSGSDDPGGGRVLDVGAWARSRSAATPVDLADLVEAPPGTQERLTDLMRAAPADGVGWVRSEDVRLLAPLRAPNSLRDFLALVGRPGRDLAPQDAGAHVFGYTVMNDWSARDIQRDEMSCWLGPAKPKDFATSLGPWGREPGRVVAGGRVRVEGLGELTNAVVSRA